MEKTVLEMLKKIKKLETTDERQAWNLHLELLLRLGYGTVVKTKKIASHFIHDHNNETREVLAAQCPGSNVKVAWLAGCGNYFLGVEFVKPVCSAFFFPISQAFIDEPGGPLDDYGNPKLFPLLHNFVKAGWNQQMITKLGMDINGDLAAAIVIRYLQEISQLNAQKILKFCFSSKYSYPDHQLPIPDGNYVDCEALVNVLKINFKQNGYEHFAQLDAQSIFESVKIDWFDSEAIGKSSVSVKLKPGCFLPQLPFLDDHILASIKDTFLSKYLPQKVDVLDSTEKVRVLVSSLAYYDQNGQTKMAKEYKNDLLLQGLAPGAEIIFSAPNVMDAAFTALMLTKAVDPIVRQYVAK
ncbi:MAG TPA: hypothetical protein PKI61_01390 [bacterium]|nr:hypothetical protein [bacterium]HPT29540.1 hypothetical protein [bacterium]